MVGFRIDGVSFDGFSIVFCEFWVGGFEEVCDGFRIVGCC